MEYTYMGLFSTIFNWIFDAILSPVFEFIAGLISDALSWIFNEILSPILTNVLWPLFQDLVQLVLDVCGGILYSIFAKLLFLLDTMNQTFNYLIGLDTVTYKGQKNLTLLEVFFQVDSLRKAFWIISCMSLGLAMVFSIYAIIKSTLDFDFENKRPVSRVLSSVLKCFINLFTVQFFVYAMVYLSTAVLKGIDTAMNAAANAGKNMSMGSMIFAVSSLNAAKDSSKNLSSASEQAYQSIGVTDSLRKPFFYGESPMVYSNQDVVKQYFKLGKFDYLIGFLLVFFLLVVMAACLMIFVQRMFDMLMLYVASPLFVSMIPLDDGERFGKWRELFIGKCFSGFGMVLSMKLYLLLCPQIMTSDVQFSESVELDSLAKMVFLLGGAYAVRKAGTMVTSLISAGAGSSEQATGSMVTKAGSAFGGYLAGKAADKAIGAASNLFSGKGGKGGGQKGGGQQGGGGKFDGAGKPADYTQGGQAAFDATKYKGGEGGGSGAGGSGDVNFKVGGVDFRISGASSVSIRTMDGAGGSGASEDSGGAGGFSGSEESSGFSGSSSSEESSGFSGSSGSGESGTSGDTHGNASGGSSADEASGHSKSMDGAAAEGDASRSDADAGGGLGEGKGALDGANGKNGAFGEKKPEDSSSKEPEGSSAKKPGDSSSKKAETSGDKDKKPFFNSTKPAAGEKLLRKGFFGFKKYRHADGSTSWSFKPGKGKLFNIGRDEKGTNLKILGFGVRWGKDGKINKVSLPTTRLKLANDGKLHVSKLNVAGIAGFKANSKTGDLKFTSCNMIGLKREEGKDGQYHVTRLGAIGLERKANDKGEYQMTHLGGGSLSINREKQEDGKYHTTSALGGLYQKSFYKDENGEMQTAGIRALGINFKINDDIMEKRGGNNWRS